MADHPFDKPKEISVRVGVAIRKTPGVTRWAKWSWKVSALTLGEPPQHIKIGDVLYYDGTSQDIFSGVLTLTLHRKETEAYKVALAADPPRAFVICRPDEADLSGPPRPFHVTASAYEAQDYADSSGDIVEPVQMSEALTAWIQEFVDAHHIEEAFVKRRRDRERIDLTEDGKGDARIRQTADVFRAPGALKARKRTLQ